MGVDRKTFGGSSRLTMRSMTPVRWQLLEKVFLRAGFSFMRQKGSHRSYTKRGVLRPIVIPVHKEVPVSVIKNN